jgi:hypothetical protein
MAELLGKPPEYTEKGRQLASIQVQVCGGPRPFAAEGLASRFSPREHGDEPGGARRQHTNAANRAGRHRAHQVAIEDGLGLTADAINARARRKSGDPEIRSPNGPTKRSCRSTARSSGR